MLALNQKNPSDSALDTPSRKLGIIFKRARLENGLSIEIMAQHLGDISTLELENYENGKAPIPLVDIYSIANILNISPSIVQKALHESAFASL